MRRNYIKLFCIILTSIIVLGCNDYDITPVEYDENAKEKISEEPIAPNINPEWNLVPIRNIGQNADGVFVYKDNKYNQLFERTTGWNGGDGVLTTELPGGNIFWSFNDSFYGRVNPENRSRYSSNFPRNNIMIQKNGGETPADLVWLADYISTDPDSERYFQARTHIRHPWASLSEEQIQNGEIDSDYLYWAGDATVINKEGTNKLQVLWGGVDKDMNRVSTCLATYNLSGSMPSDYYSGLNIPDYVPHTGDYMNLETVDHDFMPGNSTYGSTILEGVEDDNHIYLYTSTSQGPNPSDKLDQKVVLVARTQTRDLSSKWEYYIRNLSGQFGWQDDYPTADEMMRSNILLNNASCEMPWIFHDGGTYYLVAQAGFSALNMKIYRSDTPYGPFRDEKVLFSLPKTIDKIGYQYWNALYMVNLHTGLSREGELVFSTNTDAPDFFDNFNAPGSANYYRPYFYRVYNWKSVYWDE